MFNLVADTMYIDSFLANQTLILSQGVLFIVVDSYE